MRRIKISLTDTQYERLRSEAASSGLSLAELVRRALDKRYGTVSEAERLELLDRAFGGWDDRREDGAAFVERVRTGAGELGAERDDEARKRELRLQLVERLHTGEGFDVDAAYEVREHGWIHR